MIFSNGICKLNVPPQNGTAKSRDGAMRAVPFLGPVRQSWSGVCGLVKEIGGN